MYELSLDISDFGGVSLFNKRDSYIINILSYLLLNDNEAYPNNPIGLGLQKLRFESLSTDELNNLSANLTIFINNKFPFILLNDLTVSIMENTDDISKRNLVIKIDISYNKQDEDINLSQHIKDTGKEQLQVLYNLYNNNGVIEYKVFTN